MNRLLGVVAATALLASTASGAESVAGPSCVDASSYDAREPEGRRALASVAEACRVGGDSDRALEAYRKLHEADPSGGETLFWLGTLERRRGEWETARAMFDEALAKSPDNVDALVGRARVNLVLGDLPAVGADLERALGLSPQNGEVHEVRGHWLRRLGRRDEAEAEFREALRLGPRNVDARLGLARVENAKGESESGLANAREVLAQTPGYHEARTVAARALENLGADDDAFAEYREAWTHRPDDEETWRGLWRTAARARPTVGFRFKHYESEVVEGRGSPPPFPIRTKYSGYSIREDGRLAVSPTIALTAESEQFDDELEQESAGFTIYDVFGVNALVGAELAPGHDWRFTVGGGGAVLDSRTDDPLDEDTMPLAYATAGWAPEGTGFDLEVGYRRHYLFGRDLVGPFVFDVFAEDRLSARATKELGDQLTWRGSATYYHYSDDSEPISAATSLGWDSGIVRATLHGDHSPVQTYFLKDDQTLDFVEASGGGLTVAADPHRLVAVSGGGRVSAYSDSNDERFLWTELALLMPRFEWLRGGLRWEDRDFQHVSSSYSSYDYDEWGPFVGLRGSIVPRLDFDVEYRHAFRDESAGRAFQGDVLRWSLEAFVNTIARFGTEGQFGQDGLSQDRRRIVLFARFVF